MRALLSIVLPVIDRQDVCRLFSFSRTNSFLSVIPEDESAKAMNYELSIYGAGA
jgi:hypothetical protein